MKTLKQLFEAKKRVDAKKSDKPVDPKKAAAKRAKGRERHWRRTGVSSATISWMKKDGWL